MKKVWIILALIVLWVMAYKFIDDRYDSWCQVEDNLNASVRHNLTKGE